MNCCKTLLLILILSTKWAWAENTLTYFPTYEENKKAFTDIAESHLLQSWPLKNHPELTTDLALYKNDTDQLLIFSSGLHGIEGYVGSSLQRALMEKIKAQKLKTDVLFIHSLNPWGMKNKRRVNENNIDLNRNFLTTSHLYDQKNEDYLKINSFLNPESPLSFGVLHRMTFLFESVRWILTYSLETLRKSILAGQYTEAKGLYFGGKESDDLQLNISILLQKDLAHYKNITWIDLHTGYGARAKLHLLANDSKSDSGQKVQRLFPQNPIDFGDQKNFYKADGDIITFVTQKSTPQQQIQGITFEYGSMDSQKTMGSIESLRRMVIENQGFHHGYENETTKNEAAQLFTDMFFPQEEEWKQKVLAQTQEILAPLLEEKKMNCYCGKNQSYPECCEKFHLGHVVPENAEDLMRSRYSAFCVVNMDYLFETTDLQARFEMDMAANKAWAQSAQFQKLEILKTEESGNKSIVEFKAYYTLEGQNHIHHEISTFRKNNGTWFYRSGRVLAT